MATIFLLESLALDKVRSQCRFTHHVHTSSSRTIANHVVQNHNYQATLLVPGIDDQITIVISFLASENHYPSRKQIGRAGDNSFVLLRGLSLEKMDQTRISSRNFGPLEKADLSHFSSSLRLLL